jgi:ketosteroid isomerase-like protein
MRIALAAMILAGCAVATTSADIAAIRAARAEQNGAIAEGNGERAAAFWTDDVTARRALGAAIAGRAAYRKLIEPGAAIVYQRNTVDVEVSNRWPLAFETGTWIGRTNGAEVVAGRYSAQWVKRDGRWLIRSEVFVALTCKASGCDSQALP